MARKPTPHEIALENARRAKADAQAMRERADVMEAEADQFLRLFEKFGPKDEVAELIEALEAIAPISAKLPEPPQSTTLEVQNAARAYLSRMGTHCSIRAIYDALVFDGIRIGGQNPIMNLSAKLSTSGDMGYTPRLGWWFNDREPSQGGAR